ncbi:MAG: toprim domain-containing protein [Candidatus Woesearchaeota archaeon]|nr:MAG: toprim domain-containing protein [Candidatus Woesearchaeota archaeon]
MIQKIQLTYTEKVNKINKIQDWLEQLKESEKLILVEGKKDKQTLENLGITKIITLNKPFYKIIEEISLNHKEIIILTDLDKEGKHLYSRLKHGLQRNGVKIDTKFREFLFKETKASTIEGLKNNFSK